MQAFTSSVPSSMPLPEIPYPVRSNTANKLSASTQAMQVDVAIIGASVAGLFAAQAIARLGYRCVLIGPDPSCLRYQTGFDQRIFALSPASWEWIEQQGLSAAMDPLRRGSIDRMHLEAPSWGDLPPIVLESYRCAMDQLAVTVEQAELIAAGQQAVAMTAVLRIKESVTTLDPEATTEVPLTGSVAGYRESAFRLIQLESGQRLKARLIVACDGAQSPLRRLANLSVKQFDFQSTAVVANFFCSGHHRHTAFQCFTDQGIVAMLPLPGHALSMVWSAPRAVAESLMALDAQSLCHRVQAFIDSMGTELPTLSACASEPASFELFELISDRPVDRRLVLVADAAHVVHPMAGQGLNLGIGDIVALSEVLSSPSARHDPGEAAILERYLRRRAEAVMSMSLLTKTLYRIFLKPENRLLRTPGAWAWSRVANSTLIQSAMIHRATRHGPP